MTTRTSVGALLAGVAATTLTAQSESAVRLNTIGFLPDAPKEAAIAAACTNFSVRSVPQGLEVFQGVVRGPVRNEDTDESLFTADFSEVREEGLYRIEVPGVGRSPSFRIASDLYQEPFQTVMRGMYLWRCGSAVSALYRGRHFAHAICHTNDASLKFVEDDGGHKDGTGGWHDAGDYNKYVVNAGVTMGSLFRAWQDCRDPIQGIQLDLPEQGGPLPEFLAELKWELDWLLTMQAEDGSVYHKLSTADFGGFILPEDEHSPRYFTPWSSAATADFVAMTAAAARTWRPYDTDYSERCLKAAWRSYEFLLAHPGNHPADLEGFTTGGYQTTDGDERLWAAAELWESAGDAKVLADFEDRARQSNVTFETDFDWGTVGNLALFTYLFSERPGRDEALLERLRHSLLSTADGIVRTRDEHGYARPLGRHYYWGCNGGVARQVLMLRAAFRLSPKPAYRTTALDALDYLFGRNPYGRSFVTGLGDHPPMHPHDRRSGADGIEEPWPGYLVGGPNRRALSWEDVEANYRCNEIAINWNAALVYALAVFLQGTPWNATSQAPLDN